MHPIQIRASESDPIVINAGKCSPEGRAAGTLGMRGLTVMLPERAAGHDPAWGCSAHAPPCPRSQRQADGASTGVSDEQDIRTLGVEGSTEWVSVQRGGARAQASPRPESMTPTRSAHRSPGNASERTPGAVNTVPMIQFAAPSVHTSGPRGGARCQGSSTWGPAHITFHLRCEAAAACRPLAGRNPGSILLAHRSYTDWERMEYGSAWSRQLPGRGPRGPRTTPCSASLPLWPSLPRASDLTGSLAWGEAEQKSERLSYQPKVVIWPAPRGQPLLFP